MSSGQTFGDLKTRTVTMDSNLANKEGYAVALDATDDNNVNLSEDSTLIPFVLQDCGNGATTEYIGSIAVGGRVKVKLGGTVAPGDKLTPTTGGVWIKTVTDHQNYGVIAMQIGASGDLCEALVAQGMISA